MASTSEVVSVEYYQKDSDDTRQFSKVYVQTPDLFSNQQPKRGGVYDAHMGTTDQSWRCQTCGNSKRVCPGHFGAIILNYPVQSPMYIRDIVKWLKILCFNCGYLVYPIERIPQVSKKQKFKEFIKIVNNSSQKNNNKNRKIILCYNCKTAHPVVMRDKEDDLLINAEYYDPVTGELVKMERVFNHEIKRIFNKVSDETLKALYKDHPIKLILSVLTVAPNTIRPDVKKVGGGRSSNDDITTALKSIVTINNKIPNPLPSIIDESLEKKITNLDRVVYAMIRGYSQTSNKKNKVVTDSGNLASIASRFPGKRGRIRANLMGKRVHKMMRSTITCDDNLKIDEVGIPQSLAREIQIPEVVQPYNIDRLMIYFHNGTRKYPGCTFVEKHNGKKHSVENLRDDFKLNIGDVIYRDIITGDDVLFNRNPSLWYASIARHRVVVISKGDTLRMNVSACCLYNADFDGDEMNVIVPSSIISRFEVNRISGFHQFFLSYQNSIAMIGAFQDGLIGSYELTRNSYRMDRKHAMQLFSGLGIYPILKQKYYTGRETVSEILPKITYSIRASHYNEGYAPFIKYNDDDITVKIERGKLISGILDKNSVGQESGKSIFKVICKEYGAERALEVVYRLQQMVNNLLFYRGFSIGLADVMISKKAKEDVRRVSSEIIADADVITKRLDAGKIIPPIGMTTEEYYEQLTINALEASDEFIRPVLQSIDPETNAMFKQVMSGTKGKPNNILSISSAIKQTVIDGQRIREQFDYKRTLPYFTRFDTNPISRGYIAHSLKEGMGLPELIFSSMDTRVMLISMAIQVSVAGEQNRKMIKNMESLYIDNLYMSRKNQNIIQYIYGSNAIDPRFLESVKLNTLLISDAEFKKKYHCKLQDVDKIFRNKKVQTILDKEFEQLSDDRIQARNIFFNLERMSMANNSPDLVTDSMMMPVNVYRILEDTMYHYKSINSSKDKLNPIVAINRVNEFIQEFPYVMWNKYNRNEQHKYITNSFTLFNIFLRSYLNMTTMLKYNLNNKLLDLVLEKIMNTFKSSMIQYGKSMGVIAAQSLSQGVTQTLLNSKHRAGLSTTRKAKGIKRIKEIFGARDTDKMKSPSMILMVKTTNKNKVREIANHIEMLPFKRFLKEEVMCFYERYKQIVHPDFKHEVKIIEEFEKYHIGIKIPTNLTNWVLRYELDRSQMILKSMDLENIINKLQRSFKDIFIVHTPENANDIIIRIYIKSSYVKKGKEITIENIQALDKELQSHIIRGVDGIISADVVNKAHSIIADDGSIQKDKSKYMIQTIGSNVAEILHNPDIDTYNIQTDSILEVARIYGIEAARQKLINEIADAVSEKAQVHYTLFADEMTFTGTVTSVERAGLGKREPTSSLLRMAAGAPIDIIQQSAMNNIVERVHGVSGPLMLGTVPKVGTLFNQFFVNHNFVKKNRKTSMDVINSL